MSEQEPLPLDWIDEYVGRLRDHIFVREEDCLLIKMPNEAHRLNPPGVRLLKRLLAGEPVERVWREAGGTEAVRRDLYEFFSGLKRVLQGCVDDQSLPESIVRRPFALGFSSLPVLSEIALTYRCNLRCRFCYAGCSCLKTGRPEPELTTRQARRVLRVIREKAQVPSVSFTGGEPTLREDLCALVSYARRDLGMRVNLITNGTRIRSAEATALKEAGLHSAQVSLESPDEAVHDDLTQVDGAYRRTMEGLVALRDAGISVHTNATLTRRNAESLHDMPRLVAELGLDRFSMNLMIPAGSGADEAAQGLPLRYSELPPILDRIQDEARRAGVRFLWYSPTPLCIYNPIGRGLGNKGCAACDGLLSVSPRGEVLPCSSWPGPVGNLIYDDFRKVWESVEACRVREKGYARAACHGCANFAACQGGCPIYWRHFGYGELNGRSHDDAAART